MDRRLVSSGSPLERSFGYSRAVVAGDWCFVSGTTGYDYASMKMPTDVSSQTRNALGTIAKALAEAGFDLADVVRARYIVTDADFVGDVMPILGETFSETRPAATMIIADLINPEMKVEIEVTALKRAA
ncbi:MAG: RidA family protein [Hyphomicrobiales bacterium]|nr:RidA family protein [Hyphomicrobiales bacterium]